jgi:large subunit ribosomal protein L24
MKTISKKPNKKRKALYTAPSHLRGKSCYSPLAPELREKHGTRSMRVVKGDTVIILRGEYADIEGKILNVDTKSSILHIEGVTREKGDGTTIFVPIHSSKVMIKRFNLDDNWRKDILERRASKNLIKKRKVTKTKKSEKK